ncbi:MAG: selenocysteine-specific translation elongation factor [SAR324 cluster bacterium]|nr:selenocysteine-specific translation elongation factor [SAR324 cluster bacterium]
MTNSRNFVIGTSGHIDHGKTTLVKALTGVDPDRLAEEKKRGITIDLGFAHYRDEKGTELSFIDVPGHEKFVHNMLAGAAGIDAVLLVIAADDGVMPQTIEHLEICNLLNICSGMVVLTRCDLVEDPEMIDLCREEIQELVIGTFLENAPIVPVSAVSGEGLDVLRQELAGLYQKLRPHEVEKPFRFSVDRSFTIKGFGTVATGTLLVGKMNKNDEVHQFPAQKPVRLRGFQVHGHSVEEVEAGQRVAINVANLSKDEIQRGDQLAMPGSLLTSYILNAELQLLESAPRSLQRRDRVRIYLGTREVMGRLVPLEQKVFEPGGMQIVQFRLEQPISSRFGDRFIIRNFSPVYTLGGGRVIDPSPGKSRRIRTELHERLNVLRGDDQQSAAEQVIYLQSTRGVLLREFTVRTGLSEKQANKIVQDLASQRIVFCVDPSEKRYLHVDHVARIGEFICRVIRAFHQKFPEREGMTKAELSGKLSLLFKTEKEVDHLLKYLVKTNVLEDNEQYYLLPGHRKSFSEDKQQLLEKCLSVVREGGFQPPRRTHLFEQCGLDGKEGVAILKLAIHNNLLIRITEDLYYTPEQLADIESRIRNHFDSQTELTVIEFKDLLQITRKHAVELLEYFDGKHMTRREDNHRILYK